MVVPTCSASTWAKFGAKRGDRHGAAVRVGRMHGTHLRLEAVRTDWLRSGAPSDGPGARGAGPAAELDRRLDALGRGPSTPAALLGYTLLPWCDVTLWSVIAPGPHALDRPDVRCPLEAPLDGSPARAWVQIDLAHVDSALAYVERLPVRHALVSKAWRWRWSSAAWHCGFGGKPRALAEEWSGPARRDLWRDRLAGAFVDGSDRSRPVVHVVCDGLDPPPDLTGSAVDRLAERVVGHSPGMPLASVGMVDAMDPSQGELAVA